MVQALRALNSCQVKPPTHPTSVTRTASNPSHPSKVDSFDPSNPSKVAASNPTKGVEGGVDAWSVEQVERFFECCKFPAEGVIAG